MSKKQERLRSELLSEDKITNLSRLLTKQTPGRCSTYTVKNPSPQIRILEVKQDRISRSHKLVQLEFHSSCAFFFLSELSHRKGIIQEFWQNELPP